MVVAVVPAYKISIVVVNASVLVSDIMPMVVAADPVRPAMVVIVVAGVALLSLVV